MPSHLKVLVLAGGDPPAAARRRGARERLLANKAFQRVGGQLVIEYVLDTLAACGLARVWVLGDERLLAEVPPRHRFTAIAQQPGARFLGNLLAGARAMELAADEPALVAFGDHPVQSEPALRAFLDACGRQLDDADFFHAMALQGPYAEYAPWFRRTSVHMREMAGRASGYTLVVPSRLHGLGTMQALYGVRKLESIRSFLRLLRLLTRALGADAPRVVVDSVVVYLAKEMEKAGRGDRALAAAARRLESWLSARVPAQRLERYAARVLGAERGVRLIPIAHGGIALDVDFEEELATLQTHWDRITEIAARQDADVSDRPPLAAGF